MSPLTEAMIINGLVLVATLESDLGPHRKISKIRILRPLVTEKGTHQFTHRNAYPFEVNPWATLMRPAWRSESIPLAVAALRMSSEWPRSTMIRSISSVTWSTSWMAKRPW